MGFAVKADDAQTVSHAYERMKEKVMDEVKRFFRPEFLNRLDATIVFHQLDQPQILSIVDLMMAFVRKELMEKEIDLEITEKGKAYLGEHGFDPVLGARPLRRLIQTEVEDRLSDELLAGRIKAGDVAVIDLDDEGHITVRSRSQVSEAAVVG
jgi:ATP-dependent Clp protease ATP-binding subunit ClpC